MNAKKLRKIAAVLLAAVFCLLCMSCAKEEERTSAADPETVSAKTEEEPKTDRAEPGEENVLENDLLGKMKTWAGAADAGQLNVMDSYQVTVIKKKSDLNPYRSYLSGLSDKEEAAAIADQNGKFILIELTASSEYTLYGTASITREGSTIVILISQDEVEEPGPSHTFFLLYFPSEIYRGEEIQVLFI